MMGCNGSWWILMDHNGSCGSWCVSIVFDRSWWITMTHVAHDGYWWVLMGHYGSHWLLGSWLVSMGLDGSWLVTMAPVAHGRYQMVCMGHDGSQWLLWIIIVIHNWYWWGLIDHNRSEWVQLVPPHSVSDRLSWILNGFCWTWWLMMGIHYPWVLTGPKAHAWYQWVLMGPVVL